MNNFDTSAWKGFELQDLFDSINGNVDIKKEDINGKGAIVVTAGTANNGILGKTDIEASIVPSNTITVDMFGNCTYRDSSYKMVTHARVFALIPKYAMFNEQIGLFIVTVLGKMIQQYSFDNMCSWNKIKAQKISLPSTEINEPDWNYMQERIAELEQERIAELEQYLIATGMNDYELTEEDKYILATKLTDVGASQSSESGSGCWKEVDRFALTDLFEISTTKGLDKNNILFCNDGKYDFIGRTSLNWGIQGHLEKQNYSPYPKNSFSLVQVGATCVLWREKEWYASQNIFLMIPKDPKIKKSFLYIQGVLNKQLKKYGASYNSYPTLKNLRETTILLPTTTCGQPDWDFTCKYIRAIKKVVIADVVKYKDEVIANTKIVTQ